MKKKFFITTTIPTTLGFFSGQCKVLNKVYDVCAISSPEEKLEQFAMQEGIRYKGLGMERDISLFRDLQSLIKWIWLLIRERPYIVHANTPKASLLAMVASWITFRPMRIYMCHGLRYQGCSGLRRKVLIMMERITCFCAKQVLCVSKGVKEQFAEDRICSMKKSKVILYGSANGVDTEWFDAKIVDAIPVKEKFDLKTTDFVCLFIGRLVRDKGVEELIDVATKLHDDGITIKLLLVGNRENKLDALSDETESKIKSNDYIIECGRQSDVRPFIKASKLLILPSYREGFGQVLVEANSLGIPVVASRIIGCKNVVSEGVNGLLCEPHDRISLYECISKIISDKELYNFMKSRCRGYAIEHFDHKMVLNAYVEYYKSLTSEK